MREKLIIHAKRPKGEDGYHTFSIRVKEEIVQKLEAICQQSGHSRNELVGMLLEYALDNCEVEQSHIYPYFRDAAQQYLPKKNPSKKK